MFPQDEVFSLELSSDLKVVQYVGFNGTHTKIVNALGNSKDFVNVINTKEGGFNSMRVATIWAEEQDLYPNWYLTYYVDDYNVPVFNINGIEIISQGLDMFNTFTEFKITGTYKIDK